MQIIDGMPDDEFNKVSGVGGELVKLVGALLQRRGLGMDDAPAALVVALAGVAKLLDIESQDFTEMIEACRMMWRLEEFEGATGLVFDPPWQRPDFVPAPAPAGN